MELTFEFADKAKWKTGKFVIDDLQVVGEGDDVEVNYDDIQLYLDDKLYKGGISTFSSNSLSVDELFESVLNSYLRNNTSEYKSFGDEWSVFSKIMNMARVGGAGLVLDLPVYDGFNIVMYGLNFAVPGRRYYSHDDEFMVLDDNGGIVTDYEVFYTEAFEEDLYDVLTGNTKALYRGYDVQAILDEFGGEDGFIKYYQGEYGGNL